MTLPLASYDGREGEASTYTMLPVGPVADRFRQDRMFISSIMGPYGSAKTTTCFQKILLSALWQKPSPRDGVRRVRWCVIRDTYDQLSKNVMKDWFSWFPKNKDNWNGERNEHRLLFNVPNFGWIEIEMIFVGLGDHKAEQVFKGMQLTGLWLNEADTLSMQVLKFGMPRVGRYPASKDGGCAWSGIIADFNAPDIDNWVYDLLVNKDLDADPEVIEALQAQYGPLFGVAFHRQPGGRTPEAENLDNLPVGYYDRLQIGMTANELRRFVDNEFGAVNNGQPVFPEYNDDFHCSKDVLQPLPGVPISIGLDGGSTPAAVFGQEDADGQVRVLAELVVFTGDGSKTLAKMGPEAFGRECREFMDRTWPRARVGTIWGDPAGFDGGDDEVAAWMDRWGSAFGTKVKRAPVKGNRLTPRLETTRRCLTNNIGNKPGLIISGPTCRFYRRGFNNGYVIARIKYSDGSGRMKDEPVKNDFSHVHDAGQYLICGLKRSGNPSEDLDRREGLRRVQARVHFGEDYFSGRPDQAPPRLDRDALRRRRAGRG